MKDPNIDADETKTPKRRTVGETSLECVGEVVVRHEESAPPAPEGKRIHPRRPLPSVPDAKQKTADEKASDQKSEGQ